MSSERSFLVDPDVGRDGLLVAASQGKAVPQPVPANETETALGELARMGRPASPVILPVLDLAACFSILAFATASLDTASLQGRWALFGLAMNQMALLALFLANGLYDRRILRSAGRIFRATALPAAFVVLASLAMGQLASGASVVTGMPAVSGAVAGHAAASWAALVLVRLGWLAYMRAAARPMDDPLVLVGRAEDVREFLDETRIAFSRDPDRLRQVVGYIATEGSGPVLPDLPRLGRIDTVPGNRSLLASLPPTTQIVVVVRDAQDPAVQPLLHQLYETCFAVRMAVLPALRLRRGALSVALGADSSFLLQPPSLSPAQWVAKRTLDLSIASVGLLLIGPLLAMIALAIKLDSPGPVFFRQARHGMNNRPFSILKFRTMQHRPNAAFEQARRNDPRVTRVGAFLRKTSLDELPQLFNVIGGSMSLVGPRPHPLELNERYEPMVERLFARHRLPPGLTGLAQINHNRGETATVDVMQDRVDYDLRYVREYSVLNDVKIILLTFVMIWRNKDVY
ncbi:sugar transferase [Arenibaculum pallidiluteum]|uniref:sugar transferase n=1 Tax=Arenibaculum pallidiluteum TaxID=2812559 RepID=UPI001A9623B7|nr:sugar transferase [Arenibaculum pallidiluteum]